MTLNFINQEKRSHWGKDTLINNRKRALNAILGC